MRQSIESCSIVPQRNEFFQTLGNHEFDHSIAGVVPFMKAITSPWVVCNMDDSAEPTMQGLHQKSIVIERYARKIGIIGVMLATTDVSESAPLKVNNSSIHMFNAHREQEYVERIYAALKSMIGIYPRSLFAAIVSLRRCRGDSFDCAAKSAPRHTCERPTTQSSAQYNNYRLL